MMSYIYTQSEYQCEQKIFGNRATLIKGPFYDPNMLLYDIVQ